MKNLSILLLTIAYVGYAVAAPSRYQIERGRAAAAEAVAMTIPGDDAKHADNAEVLKAISRLSTGLNEQIGRFGTRLDTDEKRIDALASTVADCCKAKAPVKARAKAKQPPAGVICTTFQSTIKAVEQRKKPALIIVSGAGCIPCARFDATVLKDREVAATINDNFVLTKLMFENLTDKEKTEWGIHSVPKIFIVDAKWKRAKDMPTDMPKGNGKYEMIDAKGFIKQLRAELPWATTGEKVSEATGAPIDTVAQWVWMGPRAYGGYAGGSMGGVAGGSYGGYAGGSAGGYGSSGGAAMYYPQQTYQQPYYSPPVYSQPYYGGYGVGFSVGAAWGGRRMVCGPTGCYYQ